MALMPYKENSETEAERAAKERKSKVQEESLGLADSDDLEMSVEEQEDGSVIVNMPDTKGPEEAPQFYSNLAEDMDEMDLDMLAMDLLALIDKDKNARRQRDAQYEEGLRRTGLGNDAPGGASFQGASKVVHPIMAEACVDFSAAAMKELFPADGPVRTRIFGEEDKKREERANKKRDFMNWQTTEQIPEYADELEQTLTQLPLGGSQYMKFWYDKTDRRPRAEFVPIDNIILPFSATGFYNTPRFTEIQDLTQEDFQDRIDSGEYRDISWIPNLASEDIEKSMAEMANDKIEGRQNDENPDQLRRTFYVHIKKKFKDEMGPHIVIIDEETQKILAIYRNWEEGDEDKVRLDWHVEYRFIPWRGAYGIGFPHLIGGLSAALTGALRALLDSAHINNSPSLLKLKGAKVSGQTNNQIEPTQVSEIEAAPGIDDIKKLAMPYPYNPPSPVLMELLGWCTEAAKGVVSTAEEKIKDLDSTAPVGTAQAMIENGSKVYSAIHARLHRSQKKALEILQRINRWYLSDMRLGRAGGTFGVVEDDFEVFGDVIPVTDPNIFSETQRYAQVQATLQLMAMNPQIYNQVEVHKMALKQIRIPDVDKVLQKADEPVEMNPALENVAMALGKHAAAYQHQDHLAHLHVHLGFYQDPVFGANPIVAPQFIPGMVEHCKQHLMMFYLESMKHHIGDERVTQIMATNRGMDQVFAAAAPHVALDSQEALKDVLPILQKALEQLQKANESGDQNLPPEAKVLRDAQKAETERKAKADELKAQTDAQKLQVEQAKLQAAQEKAQLDNTVKLQIAEMQTDAKANEKLMDHQHAFAHGGFVHNHELTKQERDHQLQMQHKQMDHNLQTQHKHMDLQHQSMQAEQQRRHEAENGMMSHQNAMEMEGSKQKHAQGMEQNKMQGAQQMERMKQGGQVQLAQMNHQHATQMDQSKQAHEMKGRTMDMAKGFMDQDHQVGIERMKAQNQMEMEGSKQSHAANQAKLDRQHQTNTQKAQFKNEGEQTQMQQKFEQARAQQDQKHQLQMLKAKPQPKPGKSAK